MILKYAFCYKKYFLWIGWIVGRERETAKLYYDNVKTEELKNGTRIIYMTIGWSKKRVMKKLEKEMLPINK